MRYLALPIKPIIAKAPHCRCTENPFYSRTPNQEIHSRLRRCNDSYVKNSLCPWREARVERTTFFPLVRCIRSTHRVFLTLSIFFCPFSLVVSLRRVCPWYSLSFYCFEKNVVFFYFPFLFSTQTHCFDQSLYLLFENIRAKKEKIARRQSARTRRIAQIFVQRERCTERSVGKFGVNGFAL